MSGAGTDFAALIKSEMAKPQRQAPCVAATMMGPRGSHTGTLLMCQTQLLFFVGSGADARDVVATIPFDTITDYGTDLLRGATGPPALRQVSVCDFLCVWAPFVTLWSVCALQPRPRQEADALLPCR